MHLLWFWIMAATEAITAAMVLARNSTAVQRVFNVLSAYGDTIARRASEFYNEAIAFAESRALTIDRGMVWGLARTAIDEQWPELYNYLRTNNVSLDMIQRLKDQLLNDVTTKVLNGLAPPGSGAWDTAYNWFPWRW